MDEDEKAPRSLGLTTTQVVGSALAAITVAFLTSWAGTAGTVAGAAIGSVIATVGSATYTWSLRRSAAAVKRTAAQVRQTALLTNALPRTVSDGPMRGQATSAPGSEAGGPQSGTTGQEAGGASAPNDGSGPDEAADEPTVVLPDDPGPTSSAWWQGFPWRKVLLTSGVVLVISVLGITAIEVVTGRSLASISGHDDSNGTTVGNVVHHDSNTKNTPQEPGRDQTPTPTPTSSSESSTPTPSETPTPTDSSTPSDTGTPTPTPTDTAAGQSGEPTTQP